MTEPELIAVVRAHAKAVYVEAECDTNGWDYVGEFLDDEDIAERLRENNCTTLEEAIPVFQKLADYSLQYRPKKENNNGDGDAD